MSHANAAEVTEAIQDLRDHLHAGDTVYAVLRHVSRSGMYRRIDFYTIKHNRMVYLSGRIAAALNMKLHEEGGVVVTGAGMDMGFHVVYTLGRALFPSGCAVAGTGRNGDTSGWEPNGGYALLREWL